MIECLSNLVTFDNNRSQFTVHSSHHLSPKSLVGNTNRESVGVVAVRVEVVRGGSAEAAVVCFGLAALLS